MLAMVTIALLLVLVRKPNGWIHLMILQSGIQPMCCFSAANERVWRPKAVHQTPVLVLVSLL